MARYYDRSGEPITLAEWAMAFEVEPGPNGSATQRHVGHDVVADAAGREHLVSTVWIGLDHRWGDGPPLIFETMVFCKHGESCSLDNDQWRYSTEEQATEGHAAAVALVQDSAGVVAAREP